MKTLVTGGAGFLGFHLCQRLLREGHSVVCLDNLSTGTRANIEKLATSRSFRFVEHDVCEPYDYDVDAIFNLACPASPPSYQRDPVKTLLTNVLGMRNALELGTAQHAVVLQTSTSEVYGDPLEHPQTEEYRGNVNTIGPRSCYDEGKRVAETLCFDYHRSRGTGIKIVRIFNTYGPMMDPHDGRVVSNFIVQALTGSSLTIYGDGTQTRSFCFVDDLIDGIVRMMNSREGFTGPVNLGNTREFTIKELAIVVKELASPDARIEYAPIPVDDPTRRQPSIELAKKELGWEPHIQLREGLSKTIDWFRTKSLTQT